MNGWPFLIGRAKIAGYRVVVVPDFLADAGLADALSGAARDVRLPADTACVRELRGLECGPVTIVYRCFTPRAADYGLGGLGDGELRDGFGRPIRVTEGVVLRSAAQAGLPAITAADLERTHTAVAEAYADFWEHERDFVRRTSVSGPLGTPAKAVRLEAAEPWGRTHIDTVAGEAVGREHRVNRGRIAVVASVAVLIAGLVVIVGALRSKPAPTPAKVLDQFCHALQAGQRDAAYQDAALALHSQVDELLSAPHGTTYSCKVNSASSSSAQGTVTLDTDPVPWSVTLVPGDGKSWLVDNLIHR